MSAPIVSATDLGKQFAVSLMRGSLKSALFLRTKMQRQTVDALNGVALEIGPGEAVGLIGRNGSGKSTLLGLMARIYLPSTGRLEVRARVAPLLELGAGFHGDLTGRENIELNAVILGLTRAQVAEREQSIIDFAELQSFIDAPLRTYSSGMHMRLAFSVAIHTDADLLLIDEVLAVGDERFQQKCFERLERLKAEGRTLVFVSHEMPDVLRVATRVIWLDRGVIRRDGDPEAVVEEYLAEAHSG